MEIDRRQFRKRFPHLTQEMEGERSKASMESIRSDTEGEEEAVSREFEGYNPDVIDFLRRCDNRKQAEEVITFLLKTKEISQDYARMLKRQLKEKGVRSFGAKKEVDYYLRRVGL